MKVKFAILAMLLLIISLEAHSQFPHTLYGYIFYGENKPAYNFSMTVINHNTGEIITNESHYIYRNKNYYQIEVGFPLDWENGSLVEVKVKGLDFSPPWEGNATLIINLNYPNQRVPDIHLYPLPPSAPEKPAGITYGYINKSYDFSSVAIDPSNFNISYGWDWNNDDIVDEWTAYYKSGEKCTISHTWNKEGTYEIKVKAKNEYGAYSSWSPILKVRIERKAFVRLISPKGNETLKGIVDIKWNATAENITIKCSKEGKNWSIIAENISNVGILKWDTKKYENGKYILKIEGYENGKLIGVDICHFIIKNEKKIPSFTILILIVAIFIALKSGRGGI